MTVAQTGAEQFNQAVQTLRRYRKAELIDDETNVNLIDALYVDLFRDGSLLKGFKRDNTAFLVGRRGTGKSTIFEKAQSDFQKDAKVLCAYIDVKAVAEVAQSDYASHATESGRDFSERLRWSQSFLDHLAGALISDIERKAVRKWTILGSGNGTRDQAVGAIKKLVREAAFITETDVSQYGENVRGRKKTTGRTGGGELSLAPTGAGASGKFEASHDEEETLESSQYVVRNFNFHNFALALKGAVAGMGVRRIVIFVDDYSELPPGAQEVLMDKVIQPLETASGEFVKFKIAAYPGKYYLGTLDPQKVDFFPLDISAVYPAAEEATLESEASEYVRRLVTQRIEHFCNKPLTQFFEGDLSEVFRTLYHASFCNPRAIGNILDNCLASHVARGKRINASAIRAASQQYFTEKLEPQLVAGRYTRLDQKTREQLASSSAILAQLVEKARSLKNNSEGRVLSSFKDKILPTSHFHVREECDDLLHTLLHLQLVNFYQTLKDRDGNKTSVYALNYGLCAREAIKYGKPATAGNQGKYYQERRFNYTDIVRDAQNGVQFFQCSKFPEHQFDVTEEATFARYGFICPTCREGTLQKNTLLSDADRLAVEDMASLLEPLEFDFLRVLHLAPTGKVLSRAIADELDISAQRSGVIGRKLMEKKLVSRRDVKGKREFQLTSDARKRFFS
jgi:hypothetical protein